MLSSSSKRGESRPNALACPQRRSALDLSRHCRHRGSVVGTTLQGKVNCPDGWGSSSMSLRRLSLPWLLLLLIIVCMPLSSASAENIMMVQKTPLSPLDTKIQQVLERNNAFDGPGHEQEGDSSAMQLNEDIKGSVDDTANMAMELELDKLERELEDAQDARAVAEQVKRLEAEKESAERSVHVAKKEMRRVRRQLARVTWELERVRRAGGEGVTLVWRCKQELTRLAEEVSSLREQNAK
ncbi:hypothetical protein GUITHDRAFT_100059 [Guillardia theta CCMP2712]|uniref:Uncharacterized protein n=1 Tax=Guillardia theta (strain CCMP2712) TaxID=905079 RepID=L1K2H6_GUITC|nr:hypothetical protein GUITHDRAFT_100059 [Guillardia theta CCMP2712]EKX54583.1 hypothetical protein GUITHDRAFT_100059 [Guillardia theta CCMP2712]|eukprot:XP_005841563.1 hypothetical protein GUITHDRAFT_100059 [Guillardia theta CCMP2712]